MFVCDPRLIQGSFHILNWPLCELRLKDHRDYPWLILIPRVQHAVELFDLSESHQSQLMQEMVYAAKTLKLHFGADKMNCGALGNIVTQLHVHVIARYQGDAAWPYSVWRPELTEVTYPPEEAEACITQLRKLLENASFTQ